MENLRMRLKMFPLLAAAAFLAACSLPSAFVHTSGDGLRKGLRSFTVRGAALMDDSTLWDPAKSSPEEIAERDWAFAASGGMNVARLVLKADYFIGDDGKEKPEGFEWLDRQLAAAEKVGLLILLDMHIPPGGAVEDYRPTEENAKFWESAELKKKFVEVWRSIASRYRHDRRVMGYEIMNEPAGGADQYWALVSEAIRAVRGVDLSHLIVVQPSSDGVLRPVSDGNLAYSVHFYAPLSFTHQNIPGDARFARAGRVFYPGVAFDHDRKPSFFSRETLERTLTHAVRLQRGMKAPVILGEFGVSTSADEASAARWLKDVTELSSDMELAGTIGWRQTDGSNRNLALARNSTFAVINSDGSYYSPARFFGIRPGSFEDEPGFDPKSFYLNYGDESKKERRP